MNRLAEHWESIKALDWPEFFVALPAYLKLKASVKRQRVGRAVLCSYYRGPFDWDVWIE